SVPLRAGAAGVREGVLRPRPGRQPLRAARVLRDGVSAPLRVLSPLPLPPVVRVEQEIPGARVTVVPMDGEPAPDVRGDVLLTHAKGSPNLARVVARGVRWVHAYG